MKHLLFLLLITHASFAQTDMSEGFQLLNSGSFAEAVVFFSPIVDEEPDNITAQICLGRAKGLTGETDFAIKKFVSLENKYPDNIEVKINLAEAYLWAKQGLNAKAKYKDLLQTMPSNFALNLGFANSLFQLEEFDHAKVQILKAISLDPVNVEAKKSKKYIYLAYANKQAKQHNFEGSINTLNEILQSNEDDREVLLQLAIVNLQRNQVNKSIQILEYMIDNGIDDFEANILISHCYMLDHKYKKAQLSSSKAIENCAADNSKDCLRAGIQKVNVLGASKDFKGARALIDNLTLTAGENANLQLAKARIHVWSKNVNKGIEAYRQVDGLDFEVNMGLAEAHYAIHQKSKALEYVAKALELQSDNLDALKLMEIIESSRATTVRIEGHKSNDIGENLASEVIAAIDLPIGDKHLLSFGGGYRMTNNHFVETEAEQYNVVLSDLFQVNNKLAIGAGIRYLSHSTMDQSNASSFLPQASIQYGLTPNSTAGLAYKRMTMSYSSELIESGIMNDNLTFNFSFNKAKLPGLYLQYSRDDISDGNEKNGVFASVYYEIKAFPLIKLGLNANNLGFSTERSELYFSPKSYRVGEGFFHFGNVYDTKAKFTYEFMGAMGVQKINDASIETISRLDLKVGLRLKENIHLVAQYFRNTAANSTSAGYTFEKMGLRLKYSL